MHVLHTTHPLYQQVREVEEEDSSEEDSSEEDSEEERERIRQWQKSISRDIVASLTGYVLD